MLRYLQWPVLMAIVCFAVAAWWGSGTPAGAWPAVLIAVELSVLEVSLSFDNAVINAKVLGTMSPKWRRLFLTVGIVIAVFGVRLLCPLVIVALATHTSMQSVASLALHQPAIYSQILTKHYPIIAGFGGMFLCMVFFDFLCQTNRTVFWLPMIERWFARLGVASAASTLLSLICLLILHSYLPPPLKTMVLQAGVVGIGAYLLVASINAFLPASDAMAADRRQPVGLGAFIYLEVLDASFSLDGTIGAFAMTRDVVIILLGLTVGAMCVRSLTLYLVDRRSLANFRFLEHGAHYAIGLLAVFMLVGIVHPVPELLTGCSGAALIAASVWSSRRERV